jgi:ribosome-associated heat shock protein Hsp15
MSSLRIDKWLWAARFFKTRALASKACDLGRIRINNLDVKPAREVHAGDSLTIVNDGGEFHVEVLAISDVRGPAPVAHALYCETEASKECRLRVAEQQKALRQLMPMPDRRPTKRDRRRIIQFRGRS